MLRLNKENLAAIAAEGKVKVPQYDIDKVTPGIVHFGPSNFARSHIAVYAQELLNQGHMDCGIIAVSLGLSSTFEKKANSAQTRRDILASQDNLYAVLEKGSSGESIEIIASIRETLIASEDPRKIIDIMASPTTKMVTMTVTQNGYDIAKDYMMVDADAQSSREPQTIVEYIAIALAERKKAGLLPFGIMSLDNIETNSERLRRAVLASSTKELRDWIGANAHFYNTMVDRIVPGLDQKVISGIKDEYGIEDGYPLLTEPKKHMQLVIECSQNTPKPAIPLDKVGAKYVDNVVPYELAKLRMLNGLHMALGLVGRLKGFTHADDALKDERVCSFAENYLQEAAGTLRPVSGMDYKHYAEDVFERLENPHLHDELRRLARSGAEKIQSRFLSPLNDAYARDLPREHMMIAVAAWIKYMAAANPDPQICEDGPDGFYIEDKKAYGANQNGIDLVSIAKRLNGDVSPFLSLPIWNNLTDGPDFPRELGDIYKQLSQGVKCYDIPTHVNKPYTPV